MSWVLVIALFGQQPNAPELMDGFSSQKKCMDAGMKIMAVVGEKRSKLMPAVGEKAGEEAGFFTCIEVEK